MGDPLRMECDGGIAVLVFDRPEVRNAVDFATMDCFDRALADLAGDDSLRAVIVTGAGGEAFVSGGDLKDLESVDDREKARAMSARMGGLLARLEALPVPVLAAVNGYAYGGGCEILVACDYRIGEAHAELGFRQAAFGVLTGWGGATRLGRIVGHSAALRLLATADTLSADEALRLGLLDDVVPTGTSRATSLALAGRIARAAPLAVRAAKKALLAARELPLPEAIARERELFAETWATEDHAEAVRAFFEGRRPVFKGR